MKTAASAATRLEEIAGAESVIVNPAQLEAYAVDGVVPAAAVRPASPEQVARIVKFAATERLALIPCGARTKLGIGALPSRYDIALDMTGLDNMLAYDPGDLTLGVQPGLLLCDLQRRLAEHRQFLPLAVPYMQQATIGGTLASGVDSPLRQAYGTARDFVLGMEFVTGEGIPSKSGGRVVKNVTGYDLHKLLIGSLGTLAVITRVNFRTFPQPPVSGGFVVSFANVDAAAKFRAAVAKSPLAPATLDILSPELMRLFARQTPQSDPAIPSAPEWLANFEWTTAIGFGGNEQVVARHTTDLATMADAAGAKEARVIDEESLRAIWGRLRECIPLILQTSLGACVIKIPAAPRQAADVLAIAHRVAHRNNLTWAALIRGVGTLYFALLAHGSDPATMHSVQRTVTEVTAACGKLGMGATVPWAPTEIKKALHIWGRAGDDVRLMQRVKKVFDPQGVLAPGRFAGDI
jgi:FAD/FMN-containing dehydrogenase